MIKPDWGKAPEWANYYATDLDGRRYWYERKPTIENEWDNWDSYYKCEEILSPNSKWKESLEKRPCPKIT